MEVPIRDVHLIYYLDGLYRSGYPSSWGKLCSSNFSVRRGPESRFIPFSHAPYRLIEVARVNNGTIAYNWKDSESVYGLFNARYTLHKKIYNHKTAKAIEHVRINSK